MNRLSDLHVLSIPRPHEGETKLAGCTGAVTARKRLEIEENPVLNGDDPSRVVYGLCQVFLTSGYTRVVPTSPVALARKAARPADPREGLRAVAELRRELDELAVRHVSTALAQGWSWSRIAETLGVSKQAAHQRYAKRAGAVHRTAETLPISASVRDMVRAARDEAASLGAAALTPEHLLLGLARASASVRRALAAEGATVDGLRAQVRDRTPLPAEPPEKRRPSPEARRAMESAFRDALERRAAELRVEHVFHGVLREASAIASLLEDAGVDPARLEQAVGGSARDAK